MRLRQILGVLTAHPKLARACLTRPHQFLGMSEEQMPPDFHVLHVRMCLERSRRRYEQLYHGRPLTLQKVLTRELAHFPCGRKSLLYILVRLLKPACVVETGVWFGFSTAQILQALADNGYGKLYSIDAPNCAYDAGAYWDAKLIPNGMSSGFVVPEMLRGRWELVYGYSQAVLPPLLSKLGTIDMFIHDSEHTTENMTFEYAAAWDHLFSGGVLVSDDVHLNEAFSTFCRHAGVQGTAHQDYGIVVKP